MIVPILAACVCLGQAQRLSQGASDWYMRFHDFDVVKRHVDRPVTNFFHVESVIRQRYAVTTIATQVHNPATQRQTFNFGVAMPKSAFVSGVEVTRGEDVVVSTSVDSSEWQADGDGLHADDDNNDDDNGHGRHGHHTHLRSKLESLESDHASFKRFVLPLNLEAGDTLGVELVYEHLLQRREGAYDYTVSVSPGELVKDFQIGLAIVDERELTRVNVSAPVIGEITAGAESVEGGLSVRFNMSEVEQFHYFGSHGFTGDVRARFDVVVDEGEVDLATEGDAFLHFYDLPRAMPGIPKHVIFLLDDSTHMSGPKMDHARDSVDLLLGSLSERDFFNVLVFNNESVRYLGTDDDDDDNNSSLPVDYAFSAGGNATEKITELLSELGNSTEDSDLSLAMDEAFELDGRIWHSDNLPHNAYTLIVVVTDGRSHAADAGGEAQYISRRVRLQNKLSRIPIFVLGMGFDANMPFLEEMAGMSGFALNVIEDLDVEPQLGVVVSHLDQVTLKNVQINYVGDAFDRSSITRSKFLAFRDGGSLAVAGKFLPDIAKDREFEVEITGQSADGLYLHDPDTVSLHGGECSGWIELCGGANLTGACVSVDMSRGNLGSIGFGNRAASANVSGDCSWAAHTSAYYVGASVVLAPGEYPSLPREILRDVSSLKRLPLEDKSQDEAAAASEENEAEGGGKVSQGEHNSSSSSYLERVWAFVSIKDVLRRLDFRPEGVTSEDIAAATRLAVQNNFLTPFTEFRLLEEATNNATEDYDNMVEPGVPALDGNNHSSLIIVEDHLLSYSDLNPISTSLLDDDPALLRQWEALKGCEEPIQCEGDFHFELLLHEEDETDEMLPINNCTGALSLFTRPDFEGDRLVVSESVHQLYHSVNSQRMRSISASGDCCWLLFDMRFFSGDVEKVCGEFSQPLRLTNVGSAKRIEASSV